MFLKTVDSILQIIGINYLKEVKRLKDVLQKMYHQNKKFNLNSALDKEFIESNWDRWRNEIVDVLTDRQKNSDFIKSLIYKS